MKEEKPQVQDHERLKLFKNTKGYNWEIQILEVNLDRLEELNKQMVERFGNPDKLKDQLKE